MKRRFQKCKKIKNNRPRQLGPFPMFCHICVISMCVYGVCMSVCMCVCIMLCWCVCRGVYVSMYVCMYICMCQKVSQTTNRVQTVPIDNRKRIIRQEINLTITQRP